MANDVNYWQRRTIGRRTVLRGTAVAGLGLAGAALIGCGGGDSDATATATTGGAGATQVAAGTPVKGGTWNRPTVPALGYQHLDPTAAVWTSDFTAPTHNLLVRYDMTKPAQADWKLEPELASSWETPDTTTYIFKMRPGVKFHNIAPVNGRTVNSADMKFSLERIGTAKPQFFRQLEFKDAKITTPDNLTVQIKFSRPQGAFWNRITTPGTVALPVEVQQTEGELIKTGKPVPGTGPFIHESFILDQTWDLKRNPDYFVPGLPYLDAIHGSQISSSEQQLAALNAGDIDVMVLTSLDNIKQARKRDDVKLLQLKGTLATHWIVFHTEKPPYNDARVRQAISLVHPRREIIDIALQGEEIGMMLGPGGLNPWTHGSATYPYDELKTRPGYRTGKEREQDVAEAKKLLDASGFKGLKSVFQYTGASATGWPWSDSLATIVTDRLREVGFDFTLQTWPYAQTLVNLASQKFDIYHTAQHGNNIDINEYFEFYFNPDGPRNYGQWRSAKFVELMEKQNTTVDPKERNAIAKDIVKLLEVENPRAATMMLPSTQAVRNVVNGYYIHPAVTGIPYQKMWKSSTKK